MVQHPTPGQAPDLLVWGSADAVTTDWLIRLKVTSGSHGEILLALDQPSTHEGTSAMPDQDGSVLSALAGAVKRDGGQSLALVAAGADLPADWLARLRRVFDLCGQPPVVSPLSNELPDLTPLPAGEQRSALDLQRADGLLFLHANRNAFSHHRISSLCSLWSQPGLKSIPGNCKDWTELERAVTRTTRAMVCDHVLVQDPAREWRGPDPRRAPEPPPPASPLDEFRDPFAEALNDPPEKLPRPGLDNRPVQLHVLHSWGGGVAKWVGELADAQTDCNALMLVAWGRPGDYQCGQELRLFAGSLSTRAIRRWVLPAAIHSTDNTHPEYRRVLDEIIEQFQVDQLIVSSLVGHSLDVLRSGLPTLVVFHDYYPAWPVLQVHAERQAGFSATDLASALKKHARDHRFQDKTPDDWLGLRSEYLEALNAPAMSFAAPSHSVRENLVRIDRRFSQLAINVIPHGFDGYADHHWRYQAPPGDLERRLRIVVPGRISTGKGRRLLKKAIRDLREHADIYLVGAGKEGEAFFGTAGIHVVPDFTINEFPQLMEAIQPDLGMLLSTVSETFSYTLSELQALGIPVLATRVGALAERIEHGVTGWLIEPTAGALIEQVRGLREEPAQLASVAGGMDESSQYSNQDMAGQYSKIFPPPAVEPCRYRPRPAAVGSLSTTIIAQRAQALKRETFRQSERLLAQQDELNRRADWAYRLTRQLDKRTLWAQDLEQDLEEARTVLHGLRNEFEDRSRWALQLVENLEERDHHIRGLDAQIRHLSVIEQQYQQLINSRSWRLTRPLRFAARTLRDLRGRLGFQSRRAATLARRTHNSLRVRGVGGTLDRIRDEIKTPESQTTPVTVPEIGDATEGLEFDHVDDPTVSIIIPVYNQYAHTHACLKSIIEATSNVACEVIVVDDASTDETEQRLALHQGLTVLRNPENLGFIGTCNRGSEAASGHYLLFLNNDTAVADNWLDALLSTFGRLEDAGMVGAKLVYPDGRLQEAGGIIFADGSGWNYGRFENPDHPAYNYLREVDYCSGACIMLPADLFVRLGRFDSHYAPAYYEDTDLAFKVRQAGLKVYYQPQAVVTHFEGISSGTDLNAGTKRFQVVNQEKFLERWKSELAGHPQPGTAIEIARQHRRPRQALIVDATTPKPDQDSGSLRMVNLMTLLGDLGYRVTFMADNRSWVSGYTEALQQRGIEVYYQPFLESPADLLSRIGEHLDVVLLSRHYIARNYIDLVRRYCPNALLLFDTVDLHYLREQRLAELEDDEKLALQARSTRRDELEVAQRCDMTLVVSPHEVDVLQRDAPGVNVKVLSNIHPLVGCRASFEQRADLFFMGGYQHPPNVDAVIWFTHEIFPLIRAKLPQVRFFIVGSKAPPEVRRLAAEGVEYRGFVHDLDPYLDGCRLAMAPLRYGAGVKGKVNMSMSYGQPVIATSTAIEGMHAEPGTDVLVGDDPQSFADAVVQAYGDEALWNRLSSRGLENVERHFSFHAARDALEGILDR